MLHRPGSSTRPGTAVLSLSALSFSVLLLAAHPALAQTYHAGAGLSLTGTTFSIANGGVTGAMIGLPLSLTGASANPILTVTNTGSGYGIETVSTTGTGTYGTNTKYGNVGTLGDINGFGVYGSTSAGPYPYGVYGVNRTNGTYGILGGNEPVSGSKNAVGVFGSDISYLGYGVFGNSTKGTGIFGNSTATGSTENNARGILGYSSSSGIDANGSGIGIEGVSGSGIGIEGVSGSGDGILGLSSGSYGVEGVSGSSFGVYGHSGSNNGGYFTSVSGDGVFGKVTSGRGDGVHGVSAAGYGVYGYSGNNFAGFFDGDIAVTGSISAGVKDFKIDHPLDPEHKYLVHASVESDKMENVYNGHVTTDANGYAAVTMPQWFDALNTDFEYQLTVVGQFAQAVVGTEIQNNKFTIKTDKPNVKVSWQVTGVRHDAFALAHPMEVEQDKPENEQGLYQNPEAFGQPENRGIAYQHHHKEQPKN